ncbi:hypothetical protein [Halomicronema sp. CCY15110]|uniref:hypothetical protein n=1 Tax=Halomicronema sp. CCY15110 TaxID=2767773 RepID=UPI00194F032E|nr:hypothetical protein [Halomicronema sp. CCY15110]
MNSLEEWFCHLDDFCRSFELQWRQTLLGSGVPQRDMPLASLRELQLNKVPVQSGFDFAQPTSIES